MSDASKGEVCTIRTSRRVSVSLVTDAKQGFHEDNHVICPIT